MLLNEAFNFLYTALWKQCIEIKFFSLVDGLPYTYTPVQRSTVIVF
jgi:hypothetical protein